MEQVGIRAFKASLSRYLREVRAGTPLHITDRGQVIARVSPSAGVGGAPRRAGPGPEDLRLRAMIEGGVLRPASGTDRSWARTRLIRASPGIARKLIDSDRTE